MISTKPLLSLIIAVYNRSDNLRLILAAYNRQTFKDFEVIIADDGSGPDIEAVVDEAKKKYEFQIKHIWHEDKGWRKNIMLNKAIRASDSDYLVFTDGDCIPHRRFLEDHFSEREDRKVLCGRRVEMSERWSGQLTVEHILSGAHEQIGLAELWDVIIGKAVNIEEGLRFNSKILSSAFHRKVRGILGSNFSIHKKDIEDINGFDELYNGPGCGEDSDIQFRLGLIGIECKPLRHKGIQFHIHHPRAAASQACIQRFEEMKRKGEFRCKYGLSKKQ